MSKSQRTKGATYEREVCAAFTDALGINFTRNIGQARDGGNDIDVGPLVVECKRRKTLTTIGRWYAQAVAAIGKQLDMFDYKKFIPIVVCREDKGESLVVLSLADFLNLTKGELRVRIAAGLEPAL